MDGSIQTEDTVERQEGSMTNITQELRILEAVLFAVTEPVTKGLWRNDFLKEQMSSPYLPS